MNLPAKQKTQFLSLGWEEPLEEEMATHSSILAWRISWTYSFVGYSPWGCKELDVTSQLNNKGGAVSLKDCGPRSLPPYLMLTT